MRIACVDSSAVERLKLERFLDDAFRECRRSVGHMAVARFLPVSKEEIIVNSPPDVIVVGSGFSADEALLLSRDISNVHDNVPVFVFLNPEEFTVRNIKRFEPYANEVFSISDPPSRFIYSLTTVSEREQVGKKGLLVTVQGVKGGVGTSSIVGAFAHASHAIGKSVAIVDLSQRGELAQFFLCDKWQSTNYASLLTDKILPEPEHLQKILVTARNLIPILPPPAGGGEMREMWLRDPARFEIPLALIDLLQERFDIVIVDFANSEGIFPFAIECRSDVRLFVSANEPGSVHLLTSRVDDYDMPNEGVTRFLINKTSPHGLTKEDILDFISWSPKFSEEMLYPEEIPYDPKGGLWVGTGNSLYTEGSTKIKNFFEDLTRSALGMDEASRKKTLKIPFANTLKAIADRSGKKKIGFNRKEQLPLLKHEAEVANKEKSSDKSGRKSLLENNPANHDFHLSDEDHVYKESQTREHKQKTKLIYEPPKLRANE